MGISVYDTKNYAQYNPLSIQEIWAPGQALRQQHDQLAEEYAQQELLGGAASLGLQEGIDKQALADNKAYMDALKQSADELSTKGFIDAGRRKNLYKLKQQYTTTVLPIQNALKERNAAIQFDREMRAKDQTYESKFDPSKVAVTDYLKNNQAFNAKGLSKGKMFEDAARDFSTLKNSVSQKYPDLVKTGILGKLWTIVNSDVGVDEVAGFIANEAKNKNIDPSKLSAIGQQMHNIVENNLRKHGAYEFAGNNINKINELRTGLANAATYAINDPKFGTIDDPMAIWRKQQSEGQPPTPPSPPEVLREFNPSFNKDAITRLDELYNASINTSKSKIVGQGQYAYSEDETKKARDAAQNEINKIAIDLAKRGRFTLPKGGKVSKGDLAAWNKSVIEAAKNDEKFVSTTSYAQNTNEVSGNILNKLSLKGGDIKDIDGNKIKSFKIENGTKSSIGWNPRTGDINLRYIPSGEDETRIIPASVDDFGNALAMQLRDYVKHFSDISKKRKLTDEESYQYDYYSNAFDNAMNQLTNTQQSVYNFQPGK